MEYESQEHYDYEMNNQAEAENEMAAQAAEGEAQYEERPLFEEAIRKLINSYSLENRSDTPDYILAQYLSNCLTNYERCVKSRDKWFGVDMWSENKLAKTDTTNQATITQ